MFIPLFISYTFWILYSFFEGVREAFSFYGCSSFSKAKCPEKKNVILIQRFLTFVLVNYILIFNVGFVYSLIFSFGMVPLFYYIQNGTFFLIRNSLNPETFKEKYFSNATISSERPVMYLKNQVRSALFAFGVLIQSLIWFI